MCLFWTGNHKSASMIIAHLFFFLIQKTSLDVGQTLNSRVDSVPDVEGHWVSSEVRVDRMF